MQKKYRRILIFVSSFILLISSMSIIDMGPVSTNSLTSPQLEIYSLSQENNTEFSNYSTQDTGTNWHTIDPQIMIDVVDPDGVSMVWFSSKASNESQWSNHSMIRYPAFGENTFFGSFMVTLSQFQTLYDIKFFANDSLGHISESEVYELMLYYNPPDTLPEYDPLLPLIGAIFVIIVFAAVSIYLKLKDRK